MTQLSTLASQVVPLSDSLPPTIASILKVAKDTRDLAGRIEYTLDIDKTLAALLLDNRDACQRRVSKERVAELRSDIEAGKWLNTGDALRLSPEGSLVDGQHRLTAFVTSNTPPSFTFTDMTVVVLKDVAALDVVDTGKSRSLNDLRKMTNRRVVSARVIGGILFEARNFDQKDSLSKMKRNEVVDNHPFLDEVVDMSTPRNGINLASTPVLAAAIRCMRVPGAKDEANAFFSAVAQNRHAINGVTIPQLELLTNWLLTNQHSGGGHAIRRETAARCISAWNAYRQKRNIHHIRYSKTGDFPSPL